MSKLTLRAHFYSFDQGNLPAHEPFALNHITAYSDCPALDGWLAMTANVEPEVPGIFTSSSNGTGQGAVLNQDSSPNSLQRPAAVGSIIQIYATGLGETQPPLPTGQPGASEAPFNQTKTQPFVLIDGISAEVGFSAMAPGFVGLYQVNVRVPSTITRGQAVPLLMQVGGRSSNTVTVSVQ